jgi:hypothetical protein
MSLSVLFYNWQRLGDAKCYDHTEANRNRDTHSLKFLIIYARLGLELSCT